MKHFILTLGGLMAVCLSVFAQEAVPTVTMSSLPAYVFIDDGLALNAVSENVTDPVYSYYVKTPGAADFAPAVLDHGVYSPSVAGIHTFKVAVAEAATPTAVLAESEEVCTEVVSAIPAPITIRVKVPADWTNAISFYYWTECFSGFVQPVPGLQPGLEGMWYTYTFYAPSVNLVVVNGADWSGGDNNQTVDLTDITASGDYIVGNETTGKRSIEPFSIKVEGSAPRDLTAAYVRNQVELSWLAPEGMPDWITWSNETPYILIGFRAGITADIMHILTPDKLTGHGTTMKKIAFFVQDASLLDKVSVFAMQPAADGINLDILCEQPVENADIRSGEWTEVTLTTPATYDPTKDLYLGYSMTQTADGHPFVADNTTYEHGQGGYYFVGGDNGGWGSLLNDGNTGSWLIKALVEDGTTQTATGKSSRKARKMHKAVAPTDFKTTPAARGASMQAEGSATSAHILLTDEDGNKLPAPATKTQHATKNLRAGEAFAPYYNVYCDGELIGTTTGIIFSHPQCSSEPATYTYEVEYVPAVDIRSPRASTQVGGQSQAVTPIVSYRFAQNSLFPDNPYYGLVFEAQPVACASSYIFYKESKLNGKSEPVNLGSNEYYQPYTGTFVYPLPGDSLYLSMTAINASNTEESPQSEVIKICLTCLRGAPQINAGLSEGQSEGLKVEIHFDRETLTHFIERNGEIIAETTPAAYSFTETLPDYGTYTYRIGSDCEGLGNEEDISWSEPWVYEVVKPLTPARVSFRGHHNTWLRMQDEYAYWEDNEWKRIGTDEIISGSIHWGEELDAKRFNDFSFEINPIAHRKASNDSIIAFRMVDPNNADSIYTEWIPLPGYGDEIWYTASNLSGAKAFVFDGTDTDHHRYYASLEGLSGDELRDELNRIMNEQKQVVTYDELRTAYHVTDYWYEDLPEGGYTKGIWDMYSDYVTPGWGKPAETTGSAEATATINREHALPEIWWGSVENDAYSDIMHVIPANSVVDAMRGAFPYSEVAEPTQTSENGSKLGLSTFSGYSLQAFEPADEYKGDLARIYFYMATCYAGMDFTQAAHESAGGAVFTYANSTAGFTDFGRNLFMKWTSQDPVSEKEQMRNNGVLSVQGNRNPFVDLPELADYLWGDKQDCIFRFDGSGGCDDVTENEVPAKQQPTVYVAGRTLHMTGLPAGAHVSLYDVVGRCLSMHTAAGPYMQLSVPADGVYLISLPDGLHKVAVK